VQFTWNDFTLDVISMFYMLIYEFKIHLDVTCVSVMIFYRLLLYYLNNILTKLLY